MQNTVGYNACKCLRPPHTIHVYAPAKGELLIWPDHYKNASCTPGVDIEQVVIQMPFPLLSIILYS